MNYLAHGFRFIDDPYFVAGTAIPDWLNVVDRKARVRSKNAAPLVDNDQEDVGSIARGIVQHHSDDDWFHGQRAFAELSLDFTVKTRESCNNDSTMRAGFVGHILVELLLDNEIAKRHPGLLDHYYETLEKIDGPLIQETVNRISKVPVSDLPQFINAFGRIRFLYDYAEDDKLLFRINNVLGRVRVPKLTERFTEILPGARAAVAERYDELIPDKQLLST